ncbi:XrtA/PEP-CTERM system TPR-repeat protein PrsT [Kordiimonas marina]|uniref:XrtA/PEP-CTERM system TPR-repeat protein PrsT n=1 Tax=Kordiimonas marina TaxID=2872312 RepID=UPI001FF35285|nr:XrtA/PEP-CTERM system TPR-repeat protein PrsT [Kordiimonas marina]MCJ9430362.1 PEP-CTERM system TPR-repeat protein PrsT [Kordiimonas marina]
MTAQSKKSGSRLRHTGRAALVAMLLASAAGIGGQGAVYAQAGDKAKVEALMKSRQFDEVIKLLTKMQASGKADTDSYMLLARAYLETGAGIAAEASIERARRLGADYAQTVVPFAKALLLQGKYADALAALRGVSIPQSFQREAMIVTGDANFAQHKFDAARESYEKVVKGYGPDFQAFLGLARLELRAGNLEAAKAEAEKAYKQNPDNTMVQYTRGLIARYQGDIKDAEKYFQDALRLYPDNILVNLELAAIRINEGKLKDAEKYLDAVYAVSANHPMALYLSGTILASEGKYEQADALLVRARNVTERYLPAMYVRGLVAYQLGKYAIAERFLKTVIEARPADRPARLALAATYMRETRAQEAYDLLKPMLKATKEKDAGVIAVAAAAAIASGHKDEGAALYAKLSSDEAKSQDQVLKGLAAKLALADFAEGDTSGAIAALSAVTAGKDKDLRDLGILGGMQLRTGDYEGAGVTIGTILKEAPDRALGYNMRGTLQYKRHQYLEAVRSFSEALDRNSDYYTALRNRGLALLQLKKYDAAEKDLRRLLTLKPDDVRSKATLGRVLLRAGKYDEASGFFRAAVEALPKVVDVRADYADALAGAGHTTQAINQARETVVQGENRPDLLKRMGVLFLKLKQPRLAVQPLSRYVAFNPDDGEAHLLQGRALLATGLYTGARTSFLRAMKADKDQLPQAEGNWYLFAAAARGHHFDDARTLLPTLDQAARPADIRAGVVGQYLMEAGNVQAAVEAYRTAMKTDASEDTVTGLAKAQASAGDRAGAIATLRSYLKDHDSARQAHMELGLQLEAVGKPDEAAKEYEAILQAGVADAQVMARLAKAYLRLGNNTSIPLAERAYLILPEDPSILDTYGWVLLQAQHNTQKAVKILGQAIRRAPSNATYRYHLGMAYLAQGRSKDAAEMFDQALRLNPTFPEAADAKRQLGQLR